MLVYISLLSLFLTTITACGIQFGKCPRQPRTISPFNKAQYLGRWYQIEGLSTFFTPSGTSCISAVYSSRNDGNIGVRNTAVSPAGSFQEICGVASASNSNTPGSLTVQFPGSPGGNYMILDTDYFNYVAVYSCLDFGLVHVPYKWILGRNTTMSNAILTKAREAFTSQGLSVNNFEKVRQDSTCPYNNPSGNSC